MQEKPKWLNESMESFIGKSFVLENVNYVFKIAKFKSHKTYVFTTTANGQNYALKMMDSAYYSIYDLAEEIHTMNDINCPLIIKFYRHLVFNERFHILIMPKYDTDLFNFLLTRTNKRLSEEQAARISYQVLQAIQYLHGNGIWHRDIKPENIYIENRNIIHPRVVLADLGHSKHFEPNELCSEFNYGSIMYNAPERLRGIPCTFFF